MKPLPSTKLRQRRWSKRSGKRSALSRILRRTLYVKLGLVTVLGLGLGILYLRLGSGPLSFGHLPDRLASSIAARIGPGWNVALRNTALQLENGALALRATDLDIRNPEGALVIRAPDAIVSVDGLSLLTANLQPRSIEFRDLQLLATVNRDGSLSFAPTQEAGETGPKPDPQAPSDIPAAAAPPTSPNDASPVSLAVGSLLDIVVGPKGVIGTLDLAKVTNARLTVVDADRRTRATFHRVNATFSRTEAGGRRFDATLDGPQGAWNLSGDAVIDGGGYRAAIRATDAPVQDLLLLSGLSALPATADLELSGQIDAVFANGRVSALKARLASNAGVIQIDDKDTSPLPVERSFIDASWAEDRRTLVLERLELTGGDTHLRVAGELTAPADEPGWRAHLVGRDATLAGAAAGDPPVRIDEIRAELVGRDGLEIKALHVAGPSATVDLTGAFGRPGDPRALKLDVRAVNTNVRSALRLWPEASASNVRRFLVKSLKGGTVETIDVNVDFSGAALADANSGRPIPDESVRVAFTVDQGVLSVAEGLPPLTQAKVSGLVTGKTVTIRAPSALVAMGDGRSLPASEGAFTIGDVWRDEAVARIAFRLQGGADALSSLLQAPLIHEIARIDLDPSTTKGRTDLRVEIPLAINNIPKFADLPLVVAGTVSDLGIDRLFGKDRLEAANLAVAYDRGDMTIKGDGKIAGNLASIDVRQSRSAGGEANVAFTLDDAARARRGLNFGSQLTGPLLLKASVPLGKNPDPGTRIEADFAKAAVDQLIPGWAKPAGKPAKLSFVLADGPTAEIRELQLDSAPVQLRGSAVLSAEGGLDKAELTTFKLSPGDDMRAQIERVNNVYKVVIRGNVGDARPFTKSLGSASSSGRSATAGSKEAKEAKDFDLDLALNILTGHNDEAITNASVKASVRKENFRQLDARGRLGATDLIAQTVPRPGASPSIFVHSDDAGGVLRFLDIYRRMAGGRLALQMTTGEGPQSGNLTLNDFAVRNEPALRRIIPTQSQVIAGRDQNGNLQPIRIDVNEVIFTKARVDFTRTAGRLDFKDAAIWGSHVGFTLGGYLDYARDRTDISGTFVPAYGLNNAFAQVPLFGPLLGGNQYEGLFAVNFRISGPASAPVLAVNPLSAVAPGFLRRLFGAGAAPETGSLPPYPLPER
jgi:hypothetical protein